MSEQKIPLCILVVGLEERRQEMVAIQPSLARVFELIEISPWSGEETVEFYQSAFQSTNAKIEKTELDTLVHFTGGLPVLAHEIGDAVWRTAQSLEINRSEIYEGIFSAAEIIGRKLLEPQISALFGAKDIVRFSEKWRVNPKSIPAIGACGAANERGGQSHGQLPSTHEKVGCHLHRPRS